MNQTMLKKIREAEEEVRVLNASEENKRRLKFWDNAAMGYDYFKGIPCSKETKTFVVELERPQYAKNLGFDFYEFYHDPYLHYLSGLQMQIWKFKNFDDCTPIVKRQGMYASGAFERAIFVGDDASYTVHDAVISNKCVIEDGEDFENKPYPDFYTSGVMPEIIQRYEAIREVASDDFQINFPVWGRSAWGCAWQMRRLENLLLDLADEPEWVDSMLRYLTDARKHWEKQKAEYLGIPFAPANLYNDEIMNPIVGPKLYREKILPMEIELAEMYGGICYWHSCGDTSLLMSEINKIPNLEMVTVSAWSDVVKAGQTYDPSVTLEVQLHPIRDVLQPENEDTLKNRLNTILDATKNHRVNIMCGGLTYVNGEEETLKRIKKLCATCHEVLGV